MQSCHLVPAPSYYHPLLLQRHVASKADGQLVIVSGQLLQPDLAGNFVLLTYCGSVLHGTGVFILWVPLRAIFRTQKDLKH